LYKQLVLKYINMLSHEHIKTYASNNNIYVTDEEVQIIYNFIKNNYRELLESESALLKLKPYIRDDLYITIYRLYKENKAKYL